MAIIKVNASKARPGRAIEYILREDKMEMFDCRILDPERKFGEQFEETARLWRKAQSFEDRKYYHVKLSFSPEDLPENGGILTSDMALDMCLDIAEEFFPGHEIVAAVHKDTGVKHVHMLVNSVNFETGKMIDMRDDEYVSLKDYVQDMTQIMGLTVLDWRKAVADKRDVEQQSKKAVNQSFAEKGLESRGELTWKDELRHIIDEEIRNSSSIEQFRKKLEARGVSLTRCSDSVISYKYGEHKAVRGDTLGGNYTVQAVKVALDSKDREELYEWGAAADISRTEIDKMVRERGPASWGEKTALWDEYNSINNQFWKEYQNRLKDIQNAREEVSRLKERAKMAEWLLSPKNRHRTLLGMILAKIYLMFTRSSKSHQEELLELQGAIDKLRYDLSHYKAAKGDMMAVMKQKGLSLEEYITAVEKVQTVANEIFFTAEKEQEKVKPWQPKEDKPRNRDWELDR